MGRRAMRGGILMQELQHAAALRPQACSIFLKRSCCQNTLPTNTSLACSPSHPRERFWTAPAVVSAEVLCSQFPPWARSSWLHSRARTDGPSSKQQTVQVNTEEALFKKRPVSVTCRCCGSNPTVPPDSCLGRVYGSTFYFPNTTPASAG